MNKISPASSHPLNSGESQATRRERFKKMGFGIFLHFGLYSQLGKDAWIQHLGCIPYDEYARLFDSFTAKDFDARSWARLAKSSGARYLCLTTRHHEGFSLYDTRGLSSFDAPHSPARRDLVAEFADACRAEDIAPFFYHTTLDWREKSHICTPSEFESYLGYLRDSVEILCRNYGPVGGFWFDGNWSRTDVDWREDELYGLIRRFQPDAIITNNSGLHARGALGHRELDTTTFEQGLPRSSASLGAAVEKVAEMCQTINDHWGFARHDYNYKSVSEIISTLCQCRGAGANYLLNAGPGPQGAVPAYEAETLKLVGEWIANVGSPALFSGTPVNVRCEGHDFILEWDNAFYYFAFGISEEGDSNVVEGDKSLCKRRIGGLPGEVASACWLDSGQKIEFHRVSESSVEILPPPYSYGSNLVVRIARIEVA